MTTGINDSSAFCDTGDISVEPLASIENTPSNRKDKEVFRFPSSQFKARKSTSPVKDRLYSVDFFKKMDEEFSTPVKVDLLAHLESEARFSGGQDFIKSRLLEYTNRMEDIPEETLRSIAQSIFKTLYIEKLNTYTKFEEEALTFLLKSNTLTQKEINHIGKYYLALDNTYYFRKIFPYLNINESADKWIDQIAKSSCNLDGAVIDSLLNKSHRTLKDHLDRISRKKGEKNIHLLESMIEATSSKKNSLESCIETLIGHKDFNSAQQLMNTFGNAVSIYSRPRQGLWSSIKNQLSYLYEYCTWSAFSYQRIRFPFIKDKDLTPVSNDGLITDAFDKSHLALVGKVRNLGALKTISYEKLVKAGFEARFLQNRKFASTLFTVGIHHAMKYFGHDWEVDQKSKPLVLVEGKLISEKEFLSRFEIRSFNIGPGNVPKLYEKETDRLFEYTKDGLAPHNHLILNPIKKVENPDGKFYISFKCLEHGNTTTPGGIQRFMKSHSWINMQSGNGDLYSAGMFAIGKVLSPDLYEYAERPKKEVKFEVSESKFLEIKNYIEKQNLDDNSFNLLKQNCSSFSLSVAKMIHPSAKADLNIEETNTFTNRLKIYVASRMIADKVIAEKPHIQKALDLAETTKDLNEVESVGLSIYNAFMASNDTSSNLYEFINLIDKLEKLSEETGAGSALESMAKFMVEHTREEIISCLYNLFTDIQKKAGSQSMDHPYLLFENLKTLPKAHTSAIKQ
ncbi:MAG: hypothetical protein S4CHLAM37_09080 [Chlamydiia bacterium]|nr:hypothetical protein [Chlamydiia bacterium]